VKFSIENASRTRIVLADTYVIPGFPPREMDHKLIYRNVHILGSVQNIKIARDAVVSLILGSPPGTSTFKEALKGANEFRKGLRSFEICRSETQAAILELSRGGSVCVYSYLVFSTCSNDYIFPILRASLDNKLYLFEAGFCATHVYYSDA